MVTAGQKPGTGFYFCVQCGHRVYLEIGTDRLPPVYQMPWQSIQQQECLSSTNKTATRSFKKKPYHPIGLFC